MWLFSLQQQRKVVSAVREPKRQTQLQLTAKFCIKLHPGDGTCNSVRFAVHDRGLLVITIKMFSHFHRWNRERNVGTSALDLASLKHKTLGTEEQQLTSTPSGPLKLFYGSSIHYKTHKSTIYLCHCREGTKPIFKVKLEYHVNASVRLYSWTPPTHIPFPQQQQQKGKKKILKTVHLTISYSALKNNK